MMPWWGRAASDGGGGLDCEEAEAALDAMGALATSEALFEAAAAAAAALEAFGACPPGSGDGDGDGDGEGEFDARLDAAAAAAAWSSAASGWFLLRESSSSGATRAKFANLSRVSVKKTQSQRVRTDCARGTLTSRAMSLK